MVPTRSVRLVPAAIGVVGVVGALLLSACGASTTNPNAQTTSSAAVSVESPAGSAGASSAGEDTTSASAGSGSSSSESAGSATAGSSSAGSSAAAPATGDAKPLNLNLPADATLAAKVPANLKSAGKLVIATDATYPPNEFLPNGTGDPIGMDIDLGNAIGQILGLKVEWQPTGFDGILAGINAGRYSMSLSSFTDTKEREKAVNFVTYFKAGVSTMVLKGNPEKINGFSDLCGKTVGAENGTTELDMLTKADADMSVVKICADAGKPAPKAQGYPKQTDVNSALDAGRLQAYLADTPVVDYAVSITGDKFEKVGKDEGVAPYGIAVPKTPAELTPLVQQAVQKLMDDGSYTKILSNWGVESGAISKAEVNKAQS